MAAHAETEDPLYNLRLSIKASATPILTTSATPTPADTVADLALATHVSFNTDDGAHRTFSLTSATRFAPDSKPIDLRSCYFAWLNKDASVTDYFAAVQTLNEELPSGAGGSVQNLTFAQKIELIAWLSGETESSDSIAAIDAGAASTAAGDAAAIAGGKGVPVDRHVKSVGGGKLVDARLLQIYDGERKMGDHNSVLRGTKNIDFSPYRKIASTFLRSRPSDPQVPAPQPALVSNLQKRPPKRLEPIILLSPSASSLLRTSNAKPFLSDGIFMPPNATETTSSATNMLRIQRVLPSISSSPMTFILVDSTASFKPTYWSRVVAIFTTGQTWQFKSYKYTNPAELFSHYPGLYVGWANEEPPENVVALGRGVLPVRVDKWTGSEKGRWRDREVVERIWGRVEEGMRKGGWTSYGPGLAGQQGGR
ncbi:CDC73-domain-containing protein [Cucurbitaria berberidis CBS 394.84]|uniref:CDC73-domain-containing protein n=1 Tax=Cucurbitaria berberidis CBS 394.84 TaxID=1168544 RepID=A0A9P4GDT8_9PLEO|nr:CDC73-domain-containing protein [Cucurbitaria berberidis CBS 394.84]KAF1843385.1 CDC73-domain-containing protein [Cucurbitaria berberidis CBS 394.84]